MSAPYLWGSRIQLPPTVEWDTPHVTALRNGTFLVLGKTGIGLDSELKAWIYNADGSLKEVRDLDVPSYGRWAQPGTLEGHLSSPVAAELPDGRIGITWSVNTPGLNGIQSSWVALYDSNLTPAGSPKPLAGLSANGQDPNGHYLSDAVLSLGNGALAVTYRNLDVNGAYIRVLGPDGVLSAEMSLGSAPSLNGSVTNMAALPDGKALVVVRIDDATSQTAAIKTYLLDPSGTNGSTLNELASTPITGPSGSPTHLSMDVTVLEGDRFVLSWTEAGRFGLPNEPDPKVMFQVYTSDGIPLSHPTPVYANTAQALKTGEREIVALPGGGFAIASEVIPPGMGTDVKEIRLSLFDATGARTHADLLVSDPAQEGSTSLKELSVMADGRIVVQHSKGLQIVDARTEAVSLTGTTTSDQYIGTSLRDTMDGGSGGDLLVGAGGNDLLKGGDGNDTLSGGAGADNLNGGVGIDFVSFASATAGVTASLSGGTRGDAVGDVYTGIEGLLGSSSADVFTGNGSAILMGRGGNDLYHAKARDSVREADGEGRDTVIARGSYALRLDAEIEVLKLSGVSSRTSAALTGSNTANEIVGHAGANTLKGRGGNDVIKAASGADRIHGGTGNDRIHGGAGNDKLEGGTGRDTFVFDTTPSSAKNVDRIYDFNLIHDSFQLDNAVFANLGSGSASRPKMFTPDMFVKGKAARDKEDRVIYDKDTGALYFDRDGTGSEVQVKIAILAKSLKLTHYDFSVI